MKKIIFSILVLTLVTVACSTSDFLPTVIPPTSTRDIRQPDKALTQQAALAMPTIVPVTETFTSTIAPPEATATDTSTSTSEPNLTATPATSTSAPVSSISTTPTLITTSQAGTPTLTPTLGVLTYGTLPPAVPFSKVTLINKSRAQAYISLQNYPANGNATILEYPVGKRVEVKAPLGNYIFVAWVGGRKMTGSFVLHSGNEITITMYKDKVITQ
jgi:hypothetical protein